MKVADIGIDRAVWMQLKLHGRDARLQADIRADAMLDQGDVEACAVSKRITAAIERLQAKAPAEGKQVH